MGQQRMMDKQRLSFGNWMQLRWGTCRRLYLNLFRSAFVRASLARRMGECRRCGACCHLVRRCALLKDNKGLPACHLYLYRTPNCTQFPLDPRDLADRNLVLPVTPCGFSWSPVQTDEQLPRA